MAGKPTLKDVAEKAGVSEMTASRALRKADAVSEKTRKKIERVARELGYVPNRIAGALASRSVNLVGVIFPSLSSFVFPEVLSGISSVLGASPLQPVVGVTGYNLEEEENVIREMLSWRPAGLVVAGLEHTAAARKMLAAADIPVVEIMDVDGEAVDYCVGISHVEAGRRMAEAIIARGYRRIGFIGTKMPKDFRAAKRYQGFVEVIARAGLSLVAERQYSGGSSIAEGRKITTDLHQQHPELDCIYYSSDLMAVGGYMYCLSNEVAVPGQLAIAGFNNLQIIDGLPLQLATTDAYRFEIGQKAAEIVLGDPPSARAEKTCVLTPTVLPGQSI